MVTGSARGIGKALLLALAEDGFDVVVHFRSSADAAQAVAQESRKRGARTAHILQADVTDPQAAADLVEEAHRLTGGLRVLINNVGNYHHGPLDELSLDTWHEMFASNLHSTFYTCRTAVPLMRAQGGRIINLGYAGAEHLLARPGIAPYSIAKTGVILYSKALARAEARNGITVNVISPGVMENSVTKPQREIPLGRLGRLSELVAAARFLVSAESSYVTGTTLEVAGGWNL